MKKKLSAFLCLIVIFSMVFVNVAFAAPEGKAAMEKKEEILVQTDASGNVTGKRGQVTITGANSKDPIRDKSILTDIKNISGDEAFTQEEDGIIIWENKGNDIRYTGTVNEELPFSMKVTYFLNDQEIRPEDLAGKSGRVKVEYSFENHAFVDVDVNGEIYHTCVPFLAVTSIALPMDGFSNVESLNGGLVVEEFGDMYYMLGIATPGENEALNLKIIGLDKYINFPDSFGFTADVTDFQMPSTVTNVAIHVTDKLDFSNIETTDDVSRKIQELVAATEELVDGSDQLADGTSLLSEGVNEFIRGFQAGLNDISEGSVQLDNDLYNLEEKKNSLQSDAGELLESMDSLLNQLNEFEIPDADSIFTPELMQAQETLKADVALLIELLEALKVQLEELMEFAEEAQGYIDQITEIGNTVYAELSSIDPDQMMADAMELAKAQAIEAAKEEFAGLPISDGQIEDIINRILSKVDLSPVVDEIKGQIARVEELLSSIPEIEIPEINIELDPVIEVLKDMETQFAVLEEAAGKQEEISGLLDSANEFLTMVKENSSDIRNKSSELISGLNFADDVIKGAHEYINTLREAALEANEGSEELLGGVKQLDDGAQQLANGTERYYKEGILTASDYAKQATLKAFLNRCNAYITAAKEYTNFTGIEEETRGSIRFIVQTEAISSSN